MDTKAITDGVLLRKARLFELDKQIEALQFEAKSIKDELMIYIGKAQAYAEVEAKIKQELEAQKPQE